MAIIGDAMRQAFMPKHEYESLRADERACQKLQKPLISLALTLVSLAVSISAAISLKIVFPDDDSRRPFCRDLTVQRLSINFTAQAADVGGDSDILAGAFALTDQETVDYYWMVVFVPSAMVFAASVVYLIAGITVAYTAPARHGCMRVVENNYCASRRGGAHCLSILNIVFAITFSLLALFLGSTLLTLGSSCSLPLFWCYEISSWGLVILHGGTAFYLRRKATVIPNESNFSSEIEMLETNPIDVTPEVERRVNEGFKSWMGPSFLSSDEEEEDEEPDYYSEAPMNSARQRV